MYKASRHGPGHEQFVDQFEWDGGAWRYRINGTGPRYRLTEDDKVALVAAFDRGQRWVTSVLLAIFICWGFTLFLAPPFRAMPSGAWIFWINGFNIVMILGIRPFVDHLLVSRVSAAVLRDRAPVAPAMSTTERRRFALERLELSVLVGTATGASLLLLFFALERPAIGAVGWTLIVASVAALAWATVQGTRKWMIARADHAASNLT